MRFDPWGLGYTRHGDRLSVHYPRRVNETLEYGAGFAFDHQPEMRRSPDSARSQLWRELLDASPAISAV